MPYLRLGNIDGFTVNSFQKKYWSRYNKETNQFEKSDEYKEGFDAKYTFKVNKDDLLDVSRAQLGQMLVGVFEAKSTLDGSKFTVKNNGQEGKEIRYFINYDWKGSSSTSEAPKDAVIEDKPLTEHAVRMDDGSVIPF